MKPTMIASSFLDRVRKTAGEQLYAQAIDVLQVNVGYRCNLSCSHCHVEANPRRTESMDGETIDAVLTALAENPIATLDITGGAPELNPHFRRLVHSARDLGKQVLVRTNLAIYREPGMSDLPAFCRNQAVELVASLPCYQQENVDRMRGSGTFSRCIDALKELNSLGYGTESGLPLHLVYNPAGPFLPPLQAALEQDYRRVLRDRYGIAFTSLYALANMPIGRFRERLAIENDLIRYLELLVGSFNPATIEKVMCRTLLSVGWDGRLYDCDFNQILGITVDSAVPGDIRSFSHTALARRRICVGDHCYGCTAGHGSACTGATT